MKMTTRILAALVLCAFVLMVHAEETVHDKPRYLDPERSFAARAADLVSRMTLEEKVAQMQNAAPAIPRLGVPEYDWWNEALHGVARAGEATVFPQAIGLAATFDTALMSEVATAISDEARAKYNRFQRLGIRRRYTGLTFWSPNINIFRDPRWGRGQETYGEDPFLTSRMGVTFVRGLQGDESPATHDGNPRTANAYRKLDATAKHFAVHSGPESGRHHFDVHPSERDLFETYLPAFRALVQEGKVDAVMGAYNRVNGESAAASERLLQVSCAATGASTAMSFPTATPSRTSGNNTPSSAPRRKLQRWRSGAATISTAVRPMPRSSMPCASGSSTNARSTPCSSR